MSTVLSLAAPKESSEKKTKRKMRRDKRKVMKKRPHSADPQDNFMSELPFCVTSPTTWKELGCACFHHITSILWQLSYHLQSFIPYVLTCFSLQFQRQNQTKRRERESATVGDGWIARRTQSGRRKKRKRTKDPTTSSPSPSLIHRWRIPVLLVGKWFLCVHQVWSRFFFHTQFNLVISAKLKIQN